MAVMLIESILLTIRLFKMEKIAASRATKIPKITPVRYSSFTAFTMRYIPGIINNPKEMSNLSNLVFSNIGSKIDVKKVVVEKQIKAIETFEYLIDPKNETQCNATRTPINER